MLKFYIWLMGWSGTLSAWAWRKHVAILKARQKKIKTGRFDDLE